MSNVSKRRKEGSRAKIKSMGDHKEFLKRITKTLYYGELPSMPCLSLPVTEISCEVWSEWQRGRSVRRLHADAAAGISRAACVSPAALVLAVLYLERLRSSNSKYLDNTAPADLFLVTLMVGNKFLQDDGEDDEVICSEWAASGGIELHHLKKLELEFLNAIDWNIFVSEKSFEEGLQWLERRVALRQAALRGFFTYGDLASAGAGGARVLAQLGAAAALGCAASLVALLASALLVSQAALHASTALLQLSALSAAMSSAPAAVPVLPAADPLTLDFAPPLTLTQYVPNSTLAPPPTARAPRCERWLRLEPPAPPHPAEIPAFDWKSLEPWWARTAALARLYQSAAVSPVLRWLERLSEYADPPRAPPAAPPRCVRQWLNLSKLSALVVSVSDR